MTIYFENFFIVVLTFDDVPWLSLAKIIPSLDFMDITVVMDFITLHELCYMDSLGPQYFFSPNGWVCGNH